MMEVKVKICLCFLNMFNLNPLLQFVKIVYTKSYKALILQLPLIHSTMNTHGQLLVIFGVTITLLPFEMQVF